MGLNPENFNAFICGEYHSQPKEGSWESERQYHNGTLFNSEGILARHINRKNGVKLGLSVEVLVTPTNQQEELNDITEDLQKILTGFRVSHTYKGFRNICTRSDGMEIISITFKDIPTDELYNLGRAIGEIAENRHKQKGMA